VALEKGNMPKKLVLPGEGCSTRTEPLITTTVLLMSLQVGNDRELLGVATAAGVALVTMASLVMVLHTQYCFERLELLVLFVPFATHKWA
jgi:hypothetical protein